MSFIKVIIASLAICSSVSIFASSNPDAMRAVSAADKNSKYSSCIALTRDANQNIVGFHVNGVTPSDARILITKDPAPLSTEFTLVSGQTSEGGITSYMLPSSIATAQVIEAISQDLVNGGAVSIQITKQLNGGR